jgi:hypothetical protein
MMFHPDLLAGGWALTAPVTMVSTNQLWAKTETGTVYSLLQPMTSWPDDARSALRAFATHRGWPDLELPVQAWLRPGEELGGVSDLHWASLAKMARALGLDLPYRRVGAVQAFLEQHQTRYMRLSEEWQRTKGS